MNEEEKERRKEEDVEGLLQKKGNICFLDMPEPIV